MENQNRNRKLQRIDSDIYRIVASYIQEYGIGAEAVDVKTSADLSVCTITITAEVETLEKAAGYLRMEIAKRLNLKNTPRIKFVADKGRENAARVEELLGQIRKSK